MNKIQSKSASLSAAKYGPSRSMSFDRTRDTVARALRGNYPAKKGKSGDLNVQSGCYVREMFPHKVVFEHDGALKARRYTVGEGGKVEFGNEYVVEPDYKPVGKHGKGFESLGED